MNDIRSGVYGEGDQLPNEPQLAEALGVSRMTANKAILSLVSVGVLRRLKGKGTFVCGPLSIQSKLRCAVMISQDPLIALENDYFGRIYWKIHASMLERGVETIFVRHELGKSDLPAGVNGVIVIAPTEDTLEDLSKLGRAGIASVIIGADWHSDWISSVDSDNVLGAALAVTHLVNRGHERILFVGGLPQFSNTVDRQRGFWLAVKAHRLPNDSATELMMENAIAFSGEETLALERLLTADRRPTAIFAGGAAIAMHVLATASRLGLSVPDQLSIVGYDDPSYLKMAYPPITTVQQPLREMAQRASEILLDKILGGDPRAIRFAIDPVLIVRESTRSIAGGSDD